MTEQIPPVGPERDAEIARSIFGLEVQQYPEGGYYCRGDGAQWQVWEKVPPWSTDPHCALDVFEEMERQGWLGGLCTVFPMPPGTVHLAWFRRRGQPSLPHYVSRAHSIADAITDATLRAKLGEVK